MLDMLESLREMNLLSILLRLVLAMLFGGLIGLERARKGRPAGFRTYMLVCLGAALAMLLGQYEVFALENVWTAESGARTDISRLGAQVINGIGFLGAGTILVTGRQEVKGLITAAGLWASACGGLAIGAGFYECVFLSFFLIFLSIQFLPQMEHFIVENARNMNIYIEFESLDDMLGVQKRVYLRRKTDWRVDEQYSPVTKECSKYAETRRLDSSRRVLFTSVEVLRQPFSVIPDTPPALRWSGRTGRRCSRGGYSHGPCLPGGAPRFPPGRRPARTPSLDRHQPHSPLRQREGTAIPARSRATRTGSLAEAWTVCSEAPWRTITRNTRSRHSAG